MRIKDTGKYVDHAESTHAPVRVACPTLDQIADELLDWNQFVNWQERMRAGRLTKIPVNPATRRPASVSDPGTWGSAELAVDVAQRYGPDVGIGFVFTREDPFTGVDLDGCLDPDTGEITKQAAEIVALLDSYTEISPSGTGLHIIVRGKPQIERQRTGKIEIYAWNHYLTLTGRTLDGGR